MENFRKLGIKDDVLRAIREEGFDKPSDIQRKAIPLVVQGKDIIAGSATGSGKTLVFGTGIIQKIRRGGGIQALILTPTRELAEQITKEMRKFSRYRPLEIASVYGGVSIKPQIDKLRTADVVVGTPGRILDHLQRQTIRLREVEILVLDEADRMLDMGFIDDVEKIIRECPRERQTLLFSATISGIVSHLAERNMRNPVRVSVESYVDPRKLRQIYYNVADNEKISLLAHLLRHERAGLVMVFCNTRKFVDFVTENLISAGIKARAIHGGFTQERRANVMDKFHSRDVYVLVCTDVAARGLDIKGVSHVYNYDIPAEAKQYIHRIGRTARAGKDGKVVNLISPRDFDNFTAVLHSNREMDVVMEERPRFRRIMVKRLEPRRRTPFRRGAGPRRDSNPRRRPHRGRR
jgi:ATP-dependent RNA helicase DeaD